MADVAAKVAELVALYVAQAVRAPALANVCWTTQVTSRSLNTKGRCLFVSPDRDAQHANSLGVFSRVVRSPTGRRCYVDGG